MGETVKKVIQFLFLIVIGMVIAIGGKWYMYVTNTKSPYDEVGIGLNGYMPAPIRAWGCAKLHATFEMALPPLNCGKANNNKEWME
jgi:hypothetical protein